MLKFISRAGKSAMRGLLPRDVKRNTLDNPIGLEACIMQQFWRTQPLFLFGFESQRSLASSKFASRASIFEAFLNPWEPRKNSKFLWVFRNFQKRFPFQENNYEVHFLQDRKPQWRNGEGAPPGEGGTPAPLSSWPQWTKGRMLEVLKRRGAMTKYWALFRPTHISSGAKSPSMHKRTF